MRQVVVSELGTILFYSGIHFKPLKYVTNREDPNKAHSTRDKRIRLVGTCRKVPLVYLLIDSIQELISSRPQCSRKRHEVGAICKRFNFTPTFRANKKNPSYFFDVATRAAKKNRIKLITALHLRQNLEVKLSLKRTARGSSSSPCHLS